MRFVRVVALFLIACAAMGGCSSENGTPAKPAAMEPLTEDMLVGTSWEFQEYTATFEEPPVVRVKGGRLGPEPVEGTYTVENNILEVSVNGEVRACTWDGERIIAEGRPTKRIQ